MNKLKYLFLMLFLSSVFSCKLKTVKEDGGLIIDVKIVNNNISKPEIDSNIVILRKRIDYFVYPHVCLYDETNNIIRFELPSIIDSNLFKNILTSKGKLEIKETYEYNDLNECLENINLIIKKDKNLLSNIVSLDSSVIDLCKEKPLFCLLKNEQYNIDFVTRKPVIGYTFEQDTSLINSIFNLKEVRGLMPKDFEYYWVKQKSSSFFEFIAVKKPIDFNSINSQMIKVCKRYFVEDRVDIGFELKNEYWKTFADLSKNNIGNPLAFIIDDKIYSYPILMTEVKNGRFSISNNFTNQEAIRLTSLMNNGIITLDLNINKIEYISIK